ncbi:MAG TPA: hypothetical protein VGK19_09060 [Capsulimonadaceae bacterium]|jgi:hypothetical protein
MTATRPPAAVIAAKGETIYDETIKTVVEPDNFGRYVSIDTVSGHYELGDDHLATVDALYAAFPDAVPYTKRIGYKSAVVIGGRLKREARNAA